MPDFFISYNKADRSWAEWVAWQLEEGGGYTTTLQAWDFVPGCNFVIEMHKASAFCSQTIAILSPEYLSADFTQPEWAAAFGTDPSGTFRKLIPVKIRECNPGGLLSQITYISLVGLDEPAARDELLKGVRKGRLKPVTPPVFPSTVSIGPLTKPLFPGDAPVQLISFGDLKNAALRSSSSLFIWPTTLGDKQWLERREVEILLDRIDKNENSTTILLGPPGSGKSALLSILGQKLKDKGLPVLAIKADKLPSTIDSLEKLSIYLNLPMAADVCLGQLSMEQKAILIVDQLDALSELVDRKSERLNVLLSLIQSVSSLRNAHVVSSSRWFEFRHDTRLNTIQAEHLELDPIPWEQVQMMLRRFGVNDQNWSEEAQAMLKVPLHLKIFLDLRAKNSSTDISASLQGLLEALWQQRVLNRDGASVRNNFLHELVQRMSEDEELWVPRALADFHPEALEDLEREEILTLDENGLRIGFRHQTYFDFARARYFAQGRERLSEYVMGRQDGLFIRPILVSSLEYLRGSDPVSYRRELLALWNHPKLRSHLRSLVIEFLAALENPKDFEVNCLLPILKDESMLSRALIAMAGSHGWFMVIKEAILVEIMSKPPDRAALCASLLIHPQAD